ncbi:MAG: hypothetical protein A2255_06385 [Candidatus Melainabacteria bacterium RIFOXYA2_FULL_32_9]|nr:MAG: hypothetical protein A2255_06385 [Candidatus Melainabacteria bacterium RIFOXYA2_FULL_32_9]
MKSKKGFTLTELLLTLTIIGIIASYTIPTLIQNIENTHLRASLRAGYSILSQVVTQMAQDENGVLQTYDSNYANFKTIFKSYFKIIKDCNSFDCVPSTSTSEIYGTYAGLPANTGYLNDGQFILSNGMLVMMDNGPGRILITIDVNSHQKKPNIYGKDVFTFQVFDRSVLPVGAPGTINAGLHSTYCSLSSNNERNGMTCAALWLLE